MVPTRFPWLTHDRKNMSPKTKTRPHSRIICQKENQHHQRHQLALLAHQPNAGALARVAPLLVSSHHPGVFSAHNFRGAKSETHFSRRKRASAHLTARPNMLPTDLGRRLPSQRRRRRCDDKARAAGAPPAAGGVAGPRASSADAAVPLRLIIDAALHRSQQRGRWPGGRRRSERRCSMMMAPLAPGGAFASFTFGRARAAEDRPRARARKRAGALRYVGPFPLSRDFFSDFCLMISFFSLS